MRRGTRLHPPIPPPPRVRRTRPSSLPRPRYTLNRGCQPPPPTDDLRSKHLVQCKIAAQDRTLVSDSPDGWGSSVAIGGRSSGQGGLGFHLWDGSMKDGRIYFLLPASWTNKHGIGVSNCCLVLCAVYSGICTAPLQTEGRHVNIPARPRLSMTT